MGIFWLGVFLIWIYSPQQKGCKKSASFYFKRLYIAFVKSLTLKPNNSKSVSKIVQISIKPALKIGR